MYLGSLPDVKLHVYESPNYALKLIRKTYKCKGCKKEHEVVFEFKDTVPREDICHAEGWITIELRSGFDIIHTASYCPKCRRKAIKNAIRKLR